MVATINEGVEHARAMRAFGADLSAFVRAIGFRNIDVGLSCVLGIGADG